MNTELSTQERAVSHAGEAAAGVARFVESSSGHDSGSHGHSSRSMRVKLFDLLRPDSGDIRLIILFAAAVGVLSLASPIAVEALVNSVAFGGLLQPIIVLSLILLACLSLSAGMIALQQHLAELIQRRLFVRATTDLARTLPLVPIAAWNAQDPTKMVNRFFEIVTIQKVVSILLLDGISIVLTAAIGMAVLAFYHPILLAFDIGFLLAIVFLLFGWLRRGIATGIEESAAKHAVAGWLEEIARSESAFRTISGSKLARDVASALTLQYLHTRSDHFRITFRQSVGGLTLQVVAVVLMLGIGGWLVLVGQMTLGQLVAAELIVSSVTGSLAKIGKHLENFYDLMASVSKLAVFDELPVDRDHGEVPAGTTEGAAVRLHALTPAAVFGQSSFKNLELNIVPGKTAAILGGEGTGKSLLTEILAARHSVAAGTIEIDGVDLRQWDPLFLRERAAVVGDRGLVEGTIFDNVQLGRGINADEVRRALVAVNLLDDAMSLPQGLETRLNTHGAPLSTGQVRRLLLARALAGRPRLLILDAFFDFLDKGRGRLIWGEIRNEYAGTVLILTANADIAEWCDEIVRFDTGCLPSGRVEA